jgi:hypothetical protein
VRIPDIVLDALLADASLSFTQRAFYLFSSAYQTESGSELAERLGLSTSTVFRHCRYLSEREWMRISGSRRKFCPIALIPHNCQKKMAEALEVAFDLAPNRGEFLMKRNLDLWIRSDEFVDNARPDFLVSPVKDKPLEYDRYYLARVAFEFNGPQHFGKTEVYPSEEELRETKARDLIKKALSAQANVRLITVVAEDLEHTAFEKLLPDDLPRNRVDKDGPYCKTLARICANYTAKAARSISNARPVKPDVRK